MALPWQKSKPQGSAAVIMKTRVPDTSVDSEKDNNDEGLEECMSELSDALASGDKKAAAKAFRNASRIVDSEPHEEGEHTNNYDDLNELAAQKENE